MAQRIEAPAIKPHNLSFESLDPHGGIGTLGPTGCPLTSSMSAYVAWASHIQNKFLKSNLKENG